MRLGNQGEISRWSGARLLAVFALSAIVAIAVAGCGGSGSSSSESSSSGSTAGATTAGGGSEASKPVDIGVFVASSANSYLAASIEGIEKVAEEEGNATVTVFDGEFDANTQVNQLRDALLAKKFNAWLISPVDGGPVAPLATQAIDSEITVGCWSTPCGADVANNGIQVPGVAVQTGFGYVNSGRHLGELTVRACKGRNPCKVFWLAGNPQEPLETAREEGLDEVIEKEPNIEIVAEQAGEYLPGPAFTATQNVLQANPEIEVITSAADQMVAGAYKAAAAAGKADGEIKMIGTGCTFESVQLIKEGKTYGCTPLLPRTEGEIAAKEVIAVARGAANEEKVVNPNKKDNVSSSLTKENAGDFKPQFHS